MTTLDWIVMIATMIAIPGFGLWRGRGGKTTSHYLLAGKTMPWYAMGLSIMATQASAITFIATPGQAYVDGMRFVQFYFGLPIAMVILRYDRRPYFSQRGRLYGLRISRTPVRCQNARAGQHRFPDSARRGRRARALRARHRDERPVRLARPPHHAAHRHRLRALHDDGRHPGSHMDRRSADDDHLRRP